MAVVGAKPGAFGGTLQGEFVVINFYSIELAMSFSKYIMHHVQDVLSQYDDDDD